MVEKSNFEIRSCFYEKFMIAYRQAVANDGLTPPKGGELMNLYEFLYLLALTLMVFAILLIKS